MFRSLYKNEFYDSIVHPTGFKIIISFCLMMANGTLSSTTPDYALADEINPGACTLLIRSPSELVMEIGQLIGGNGS